MDDKKPQEGKDNCLGVDGPENGGQKNSDSAVDCGAVYCRKDGSRCRVKLLAKDAKTGAGLVVYQNEDDLKTYLVQEEKTFLARAKLASKESPKEEANRIFLQLLDAKTYREKRELLMQLRPNLTPVMLENIAAAHDIVLEGDDLQMQYESLLKCFDTFEHYDGRRLR